MRFITLSSENKVLSIRNGISIVEGEIQSDIGELGQILQPDGTFIDAIPPLEQARPSKLAQINGLYNQSLADGFSSLATGTPYTFGYGQSDREKFTQLAISVLSNIATFPVPIPSKDGEIVIHEQAQYQQLIGDISVFAWTMQNKIQTLSSQVKVATTVEEVNAVVW